MKEKRIRVLKVEPYRKPAVSFLENELTALQEAVSIGASSTGLIEIINLNDRVCILCNEESKIMGMEPNRRLGNDIVCGVFYVVGQDKNRELISLSDAEIEYYTEMFRTIEIIPWEDVEKTMKFVFRFM